MIEAYESQREDRKREISHPDRSQRMSKRPGETGSKYNGLIPI
jgi:hypothetical protein